MIAMEQKNNPFSMTFGKAFASMVERDFQNNEIISGFLNSPPTFQVCMLTGVRGSGKTVAMTGIANSFKEDESWIVIDLNGERDMLEAMAAELASKKSLTSMFKNAHISISLPVLGIDLPTEPIVSDPAIILDQMLDCLTRKGKKVLVTIDEVSSNRFMKEYISQFQIYIRKDYNIFLIMAGLYENIYELQNQKTLTFLYRAPKIELKPLNTALVAQKYENLLNVSPDKALEMAKLIKGYPFAYQVMGYLYWNSLKSDNTNAAKTADIDLRIFLPQLDYYLEEFVYEKIWSELSAKDKEVLIAISGLHTSKVALIRDKINMNSNTFNVYRKRLIKKGVVKASEYGHLTFTLPRFEEFITRQYI